MRAREDREVAWPADQVERWPIDRLIPYAKNSRTHSEAQIAQLAASMKEWGWTNPILADEAGGIARWAACTWTSGRDPRDRRRARRSTRSRMNKPFVPTAEQRQNVEAMIGFGIPIDDIARLIKNPATNKPLDLKTLRKHFADEIATGFTKATAAVAQSLFAEATKGGHPPSRVSAAQFWLSRRGGWKETTVTEHTGKDGTPIDVRHSIELKLDRLHQTLTRREAGDTTEDAAGEDSGEL
jgi:hypothetical protein